MVLAAPTVTFADGPANRFERAARAEEALRADDAKLRFRHNIIHVIKLWQTAKKYADPADRPKLMHREAQAWALLAHWSGRSDDARRAAREAKKARAAARATKVAPTPASPAPASAPPRKASPRVVVRAPVVETAPPSEPDACTRRDRGEAVPTIVIDPGHGGDDRGAKNRDGVLEKNVNLAIAKELARRLEDHCVVWTRTADTFVSLADRVRIANSSEADLFVSIHANGSPRSDFHGVETYVLDTDARRYGRRLRDRESELHGEAPGPDADLHWQRDVHLLLADLAMRGATIDARRLASRVQDAVTERLRALHPDTKDLGVKSALFYVLLGARMPSILVESGFMTHPIEGRRLARRPHQEQIARAIADGVRAFSAERASRSLRVPPIVAAVD